MKKNSIHLAGLMILLAMIFSLGRTAQSAKPPTIETNVQSPTDIQTISDIQINEVMFKPAVGGFEWVELKNYSTAPVKIRGYSLTNEIIDWYKFPDVMPDVPAGAFVVVVFDGLGNGSNDYDFSDNFATLHSQPGQVDIFSDEDGQVALYKVNSFIYLPLIARSGPGTASSSIDVPPIVSFVAWGVAPGAAASNASLAGIWNESWYVNLNGVTGIVVPEIPLVPNETLGLLPSSPNSFPDHWVTYQSSEATPGGENSVPGIKWYYPSDGATIDGATFSVSWNYVEGASGYHFQMSDTNDFSGTLLVDETLTLPAYIPKVAVADGIHYWRLQVLYPSGASAWTSVHTNQSINITLPLAEINKD
jgi:hypothetical protein